MKTCVIWDLDGTLLDTLGDLADSVNYTLAQFGLPPRSLGEIRGFVGNGVKNLLLRSMPGQPTDPPLDAVLPVYLEYYAAHNQIKTCPYDGVADALGQIGARWPMAIVSNKQDSAVKALCARFFPGIYARGESGDCARKPAPDMVLKAMEELGADRCVYVGDSEVDILTARNAGAKCLSVCWGFRDRDVLLSAGATQICEKPEALYAFIEKMTEE